MGVGRIERRRNDNVGSEMSNKAVFLDRDDTLMHDSGYISDPGQVRLIDGAAEALKDLKSMGYKLVVVSNQSGVARGILTEKTLGEIHNRLKGLLAERGAFLDRIYYCPYLPDGAVAKYRKESDWRKPAPGMLLAAAKDMDIDLEQSWMVGDEDRDIEAGMRAGCKTILILGPAREIQIDAPVHKPDYRAVNLKEAANVIRQHNRTSRVSTAPGESAKAEIERAEELRQEPEQKVETDIAKAADAGADQMRAEEDGSEVSPARAVNGAGAEEVLKSILEQLRSMQRENLFDEEFSLMRAAAGLVQVVVVFLLLAGVWFLMSGGGKDSSVFMILGFAAVLQIMALTFYMMRERK
jgi:D-glycero-D-manno-heptose 1,7-bisphosphate phosphatase